MPYLIIVLLFFLFSPMAIANCNLNKNASALHYSVVYLNKERKIKSEQLVVLWRRDKQVAIQNVTTKITELWELTTNNRLRLVKYFDDYQRGIEYQPGEVNHGQGENDWSLKQQLVSNSLINNMSVDSSLEDDCGVRQNLSLAEEHDSIKLTWAPDRSLMLDMEVKNGDGASTWTLQKTETDQSLIKDYFASLLGYQTNDYIDIGDNESDPFLLKMIKLGFVDHNHNKSGRHAH